MSSLEDWMARTGIHPSGLWFRRQNGQLGDGTRNHKHEPVQVEGLSDAAALAGGQVHSLSALEDETAWAWG